jgi:hypothetical protein
MPSLVKSVRICMLAALAWTAARHEIPGPQSIDRVYSLPGERLSGVEKQTGRLPPSG